MTPKRIAALLCAAAIPVLNIATIILFIAGSRYASLFLAISMGFTFFMVPVMYLVTRFPKDMGEIYGNLSDMAKKGEKEEKK